MTNQLYVKRGQLSQLPYIYISASPFKYLRFSHDSSEFQTLSVLQRVQIPTATVVYCELTKALVYSKLGYRGRTTIPTLCRIRLCGIAAGCAAQCQRR